jgi:hypothetical protein
MKNQGKSYDKESARSKFKKADKSKQEQGQNHMTGNRGRSLGSEFAIAVGNVKEQARAIKGSKVGFLGVEKQSIETKELASNDKLSACKEHKARKKERK